MGSSAGDTSQWYPDLVYDNHQVEPPKSPEEGYHLTEDLIDSAIGFIADAKQVDPDKPFYLHFCFGRDARAAPCAEGVGGPVQGCLRRRLGRLSGEGLRPPEGARHRPASAELSRHDPDVPDVGVAASDEQRRLYARMMEVFAGLPQPHRPPHRPAAGLSGQHG